MDECEYESGMELQWHTLDKMIHLIVSPIHDTIQKKFIQAKDKAALNEYVKTMDIENVKGSLL